MHVSHSEQLHQSSYPMYPTSQSYEGWPGMALKQIMGQIDLLNFQGNQMNYGSGGGHHWNSKEFYHTGGSMSHNNSQPLSCGVNSNSSNTNGMMHCHTQPQPIPQPQQQQAQQPNMFKSGNCFETNHAQDSDSAMAWLGPQVWNRRIGVDISTNENSNSSIISSNSTNNNNLDQAMSFLDTLSIPPGNKIKQEVNVDNTDSNNSNNCNNWLSLFETPENCPSEMGDTASNLSNDDEFSAADLALASAPGLHFNPKTRCFTPEELKPQPIIRKRRKMYVADNEKNEEYWAKRVKNNVAARRSREARRLKENQIALRAAFLEKENSALRTQVQALNDQHEEMKKDVEQLMINIKSLQGTTSPKAQQQQQHEQQQQQQQQEQQLLQQLPPIH